MVRVESASVLERDPFAVIRVAATVLLVVLLWLVLRRPCGALRRVAPSTDVPAQLHERLKQL